MARTRAREREREREFGFATLCMCMRCAYMRYQGAFFLYAGFAAYCITQSRALCCRYLTQTIGVPCTPASVGLALRNGSLPCLVLLLERQASGTRVRYSVKLSQRDSEGIKEDIKEAARKQYSGCLAFARQHGLCWSVKVCGLKPQRRNCHSFPVFVGHNRE
jgi:hypothetical protein